MGSLLDFVLLKLEKHLMNKSIMRPDDEKILTMHPAGKHGVHILKRRYEKVKNAIIDCLRQQGEITFDMLSDQVADDLNRAGFDGKPLWYIVTVKLDLEARKIIERIPGISPQKLRLKSHSKPKT